MGVVLLDVAVIGLVDVAGVDVAAGVGLVDVAPRVTKAQHRSVFNLTVDTAPSLILLHLGITTSTISLSPFPAFAHVRIYNDEKSEKNKRTPCHSELPYDLTWEILVH